MISWGSSPSLEHLTSYVTLNAPNVRERLGVMQTDRELFVFVAARSRRAHIYISPSIVSNAADFLASRVTGIISRENIANRDVRTSDWVAFRQDYLLTYPRECALVVKFLERVVNNHVTF